MTGRARATVQLRAVPDQPPRAAGYIRVSMAREEMVSPALQRQAIEDHCKRRGYVLGDVVEDLDATGRNFARAGVQKVIEQIEARAADVVVVWKYSRFGRDRKGWAVNLDRVESVGGRLESATEDVDSTTSTGRFTRGMLAEISAWESERIGDQWKEAQSRRLRMGLPHSGGPRFGYVYDKATGYTPDAVSGPVLADLYARYIAGEGFQQLAISLNRSGARTMRGGRWTATTLMRQLDSGFAAGLLQTGTRRGTPEHQPGGHPPLIATATWEAYLRQRNRLRRMPPRARHPIYPLTGLVKCGLCGSALAVYSKRDRAGVMQAAYMYRCTGWQHGACSGVWITRAAVERAVLAEVAEHVKSIDARAATKTARVAARTRARADRARLLREQQRLAKTLAQLTVQVASGLVPEQAYRDAREELEAQQAELVTQLADVVDDDERLGANPTALQGLLREWDILEPHVRRDALADFVRRVEIVGPEEASRVRVIPVV
jgi:site-specific DNA recombinase